MNFEIKPGVWLLSNLYELRLMYERRETMNKNIKSILCGAIVLVTLMIATVPVFGFTNGNFGGETYGNRWSIVAGQTLLKDSQSTPIVNWNYSNKSNHRQWFSIIPEGASNGVGEALFSFKVKGSINSHSSKVGKKYYLKSKREHFIDPPTYISGVWTPN